MISIDDSNYTFSQDCLPPRLCALVDHRTRTIGPLFTECPLSGGDVAQVQRAAVGRGRLCATLVGWAWHTTGWLEGLWVPLLRSGFRSSRLCPLHIHPRAQSIYWTPHPTRLPHMQVLFVRLALCLRLPSDPALRRTPLPSANRSPCRAGRGLATFCGCLTSSESPLLGAPKKKPPRGIALGGSEEYRLSVRIFISCCRPSLHSL